MPSKIVYLCIVLGYHLNITSTKKSPQKEQISIYKKRVIPENNSLYKSCASRNRTGDTRPIIDTASPLLYQLSYGTNKHKLFQACLTIGNERIVRWCNITDLQSVRNESRFWIGSLFFPKLADCLPTFVSFLSLVVLSLYRKLNAW